MVDRKILNYNLLILGGIFINVLNTLTSLIMLIWLSNEMFIKKLNQEELLKYKSILKDSLLILFLFLSIVFAIYIDKSQISISPYYITISLIVGLIFPMIIFKATKIKKVLPVFSKSFLIFKASFNFIYFLTGIAFILNLFLGAKFFKGYLFEISVFIIIIHSVINKFKI